MPWVRLSLQRTGSGDMPEGREIIVLLCALCSSPNHSCEQEWVNHSSGCGLCPEVEVELCNSVCCWLGVYLSFSC